MNPSLDPLRNLLLALLLAVAVLTITSCGQSVSATDSSPGPTTEATIKTATTRPGIMDASRGGGPGPGEANDKEYRTLLDSLCLEGWQLIDVDPDFLKRNHDWDCKN